jgi:hypothetical protein
MTMFDELSKIPMELMDSNLMKTLQLRGSNYGDYTEMATVAQTIKRVFQNSPGWDKLSDPQRESLDMCATKMARIVCGEPSQPDSWHDIGGYAKLAEDRCPRVPAPVPFAVPDGASHMRRDETP